MATDKQAVANYQRLSEESVFFVDLCVCVFLCVFHFFGVFCWRGGRFGTREKVRFGTRKKKSLWNADTEEYVVSRSNVKSDIHTSEERVPLASNLKRQVKNKGSEKVKRLR